MITIKPCPFCGSRVWINKGEFKNINYFVCSNIECHAVVTIESDYMIEALEKFNNRCGE